MNFGKKLVLFSLVIFLRHINLIIKIVNSKNKSLRNNSWYNHCRLITFEKKRGRGLNIFMYDTDIITKENHIFTFKALIRAKGIVGICNHYPGTRNDHHKLSNFSKSAPKYWFTLQRNISSTMNTCRE